MFRRTQLCRKVVDIPARQTSEFTSRAAADKNRELRCNIFEQINFIYRPTFLTRNNQFMTTVCLLISRPIRLSMKKVMVKILQGRPSVVMQNVLGGLTIYPPVANFLQCICIKKKL